MKIIIIVALATCFTFCNEQQTVNKPTTKIIQQATDTTKIVSPFFWNKINEDGLGSCNKISKEQMLRINKVHPILFKEYSTINEYGECLEFIYDDVDKYSPLILDFISVERVCCPQYTFYIKFYPTGNKVSLIVGGNEKIKELAKEYIKE